MSQPPSFFESLVIDLLRSKKSNYSQQCIGHYIQQPRYCIQQLPKITNKFNQTLKCTLIKHKPSSTLKPQNNQTQLNSKCVIYLHGLGSTRLEALSIAKYMKKGYCLCMFDLSGSGKSQGDYVTYGMKEKEDIQPLILFLHLKRFIKEFVIWGRSMGAVATLLYMIQKTEKQKPNQKRNNHFIKQQKPSINICNLIKCVVVDSPFHNFKDIAKFITLKKFSIPSFLIDLALNYVEDSFSRILNFKDHKTCYSPFQINFSQQINLKTPIIFLYSQNDEVIPCKHSQKIIHSVKSTFEKILINQCTHNQSRPEYVIKEIFNKIDQYKRKNINKEKKMSISMHKEQSIKSIDKRRGIFLYTPSKEKKYDKYDSDMKRTIDLDICNRTIEVQPNQRSYNTLYNTINTENYMTINRTQQSSVTLNKENDFSRLKIKRNRLNLSTNRRKSLKEPFNLNNQENFSKFCLNTIDIETNLLISKKLDKEKQINDVKIIRPKRFNFQEHRKKAQQVKLTHDRYLL